MRDTKSAIDKIEKRKTMPHTHATEEKTVYFHSHEETKEAGYGHEDKEENHSHKEEYAYLHSHGHVHSHTHTKAVLNRMSRIIGHMEAIKKMVEDGRDCAEVLVQISAVRSALNGVGKVILKDHIDHCIVDAVRENDVETIEELKKAIDKFL